MNAERYWLARNGETQGPYLVGQVRRMWESGQIMASDHLCLDGTGNWIEAGGAIEGIMQPPQAMTQSPPLTRSTNTGPSQREMMQELVRMQKAERKRTTRPRDITMVSVVLSSMAIACVPPFRILPWVVMLPAIIRPAMDLCLDAPVHSFGELTLMEALDEIDQRLDDVISREDTVVFALFSRQLKDVLATKNGNYPAYVRCAKIIQRHSLRNLIPSLVANIDRTYLLFRIRSIKVTYPLTVPLVSFGEDAVPAIRAALRCESNSHRHGILTETLIGIQGVQETLKLLDEEIKQASSSQIRDLLLKGKEDVERFGSRSVFLSSPVPRAPRRHLPLPTTEVK